MAGWTTNFEGVLTGADLTGFSVPDGPGFFSAFRDVLEGSSTDTVWPRAFLSRFLDAVEKAKGLGPDALCIAISSL